MLNSFNLALKSIWSNKMRSFLTMLGVIIGIASIIAIVSTIKGTNDQIMKNLIGAGNNAVTVTLHQGEDYYYIETTASGWEIGEEPFGHDVVYVISADPK